MRQQPLRGALFRNDSKCYLLVSPISYSLSLSSSKISTSSLPVMERLVFLLILSLASVMAKRSPLLHSIGSSRMAAGKQREVKWIAGKEKRKDRKSSSPMVAALSALQSRNAVVNSFKCFYVGHLVLF